MRDFLSHKGTIIIQFSRRTEKDQEKIERKDIPTMTNKLFYILTVLCCAISLSCSAAGGRCGKGVKWKWNPETGVLTITGKGQMKDYAYFNLHKRPWHKNRDEIKCFVVEQGVTHIGKNAFSECDKLASVIVDPSNPIYCDIDGVLFSKDKATLLAYPKGNRNTRYVVPATATTIADHAFFSCDWLQEVIFPDGLADIDSWAFLGCDNLTKIVLPVSIKYIGYGVFYLCDKLKEIQYPQGLDVSHIDAPASTQLIPY